MNTDATNIQNEIIGLEKQYWKAMIDKDIESAISLTHFPCLVTGPHGARRVNENDYRDMLKKSDPERYKGIQLKDTKVEVLNDQTAMITYSTEINGQDLLDVSTWIRENEKWVCAYHGESLQ